MNELAALITPTETPGLGPVKIRLLVEKWGSAAEALKQLGIASKGRILEQAERLNLEIIPFNHPKYPKRLLELKDFPVVLYVKGELKPSDQQNIAIVGTRDASPYGKEMAFKIAQELTSEQFTVVSGLAKGIDTEAHKGALVQGRTLAIIGSGHARMYPSENIPLAEKIAENGAIISEYPPDTPPNRQNFPKRNRIISGISLGTLLIEAPIKSGAMITMEYAKEQKRRLFAIPGRIDDPSFEGNHLLLKRQQATLIENGSDLTSSILQIF